jgi:hypothetical protein
MNESYSRIIRCEIVHKMVRINQTQLECAVEHGCSPGCHCPLVGCSAHIHAARRGHDSAGGRTT